MNRPLACLALSTTLLIGAAAPAYKPLPGEGVICMMALVNVAVEVGRRCYPGQNAAFQAEIERSVARIDQYVLTNSAMTPEEITKFKREQAGLGAPSAKLCHSEMTGLYKAFLSSGAEKLKSGTDELLARPGKPTWGDCL